MFHKSCISFIQRHCRGQQGTGGQPAPSPGSATPGGSACFIDDSQSPTVPDNLVEEVIRGKVFSISNDATQASQQSSPYVVLTATATLKRFSRQVSARGCADTGSSANFCPEQLAVKLKANIVIIPGRSYSYKDATWRMGQHQGLLPPPWSRED